MSFQDRGPEEPQQLLQETAAARIIQKAWTRYVHREVFRYFKLLINWCNQRDPQSILKAVNPREAELLDAAAGVFIRFRLGGINFPPNIYYKIFTHRPIADVCANSPKNYTQLGLEKPEARQSHTSASPMREERSGWYQRMENNSWRVFCKTVLPVAEPTEFGADKKMDFHFSRLQRQQDVERWRKRRKIEWLRQMYNHGRTRPVQEHTLTRVEKSAQEAMDHAGEKGDNDMDEWEFDELLSWTTTLCFEEYMKEWRRLACSHSSEPSKDLQPDEYVSDDES